MAFITEEEWKNAYDAAQRCLLLAIDRGDLEWPNGNGNAVVARIAREIATAVILSSSDGDDITDVEGVQVERFDGR